MKSSVLMLLTNKFRPDPRVYREALALSDGGYQVTVLAWDRETGSLPVEEFGSVVVKRITTRKVRGMASLLLNYPSFCLRLLEASKKMDLQIVHAHDFDTLLPGLLISKLRRVPLVYDAHERYSKMIAVDVPPAVCKAVEMVEARLMKRSALFITINQAMGDHYRARASVEAIIIANVIELPDASLVKKHQPSEIIVIIYAGTLEPQRYLEETVGAVKRMEHIEYWVAGSGRFQGLIEKAASETKNIRFLGFLPHEKLMEEMRRSDVVLLLLDPENENYRLAATNKMAEAMAYGIPLITSKRTLSAEIIEGAGCGIAIEWSEENFRQAVDLMRDPDLRNIMGRKGREAAENEYNWGIMRRRLLAAYAKLLDK